MSRTTASLRRDPRWSQASSPRTSRENPAPPLSSTDMTARRRRNRTRACSGRMWAESIGTTVRATTSDTATATATARAMSRNNCPASCRMNRTGTNTATVVSVEATMAPLTSRPPSTAARRRPLPISRWRKMFSSTTTALSTTMPVAKARPASMMTLSEEPRTSRTTKVVTMDTGIATATTRMLATLLRNSSNTSTARATAK